MSNASYFNFFNRKGNASASRHFLSQFWHNRVKSKSKSVSLSCLFCQNELWMLYLMSVHHKESSEGNHVTIQRWVKRCVQNSTFLCVCPPAPKISVAKFWVNLGTKISLRPKITFWHNLCFFKGLVNSKHKNPLVRIRKKVCVFT